MSEKPGKPGEDTCKEAETIKKFEAMLTRGMDSPMLRLTLGNAYWKAQELDRAAEHLNHAVQQKPDYSAAWKVLGRVYADDGEFQHALDAYDKGLACAAENGDKQSEKEIKVFRKRVVKAIESQD